MNSEDEDKRIVKIAKIVFITVASTFLGVFISLIFLLRFEYYLPGAKIMAYIDPEEPIIEMAEKALQKKYREEFIVHDVWSKASNECYADCSPVSNEEVVFLAVLGKDGGIEYDEYLQGVISRKISDRFQEELGQIFDDCYVYTSMPYTAAVEFDNVPDTTIEQYVEKYREEYGESGCWVIRIFINLEREQEGDVEREYEYFSQIVSELIERNQTPDIYIDLYGVDEETRNWCENYFSVNAIERGKFTSMEAKNPYFSIRYKEGEITKTFEEYKEYIESRSSLLKEK
ncbi:MAG: hypothetical protein K2O32_00030 [Acetatifactor sp.]|nr:hypothetical protein [Acetatifactor sp.]